jgi:hypothetical protein
VDSQDIAVEQPRWVGMAFNMADEARLYRERATAERQIADGTILPNVRDRARHAARRWDELADQAERSKVAAAARQGRGAYSSAIARLAN